MKTRESERESERREWSRARTGMEGAPQAADLPCGNSWERKDDAGVTREKKEEDTLIEKRVGV